MLVAAAPATAAGVSTSWEGFDEGQVRLISAQSAAGSSGELRLGIEFKLNEGWKTYWRYAGEAGAAPRLDWSGSDNVAAVNVSWPAPIRFSTFGFDSFGYKDRVILPVSLRPKAPGEAVSVDLKIDYLACADICVPGQAHLRLPLNEGEAVASEFAEAIKQYDSRVPTRGATAPFAVEGLAVAGDAGQQTLTLRLSAQEAMAEPDIVVEVAQPLSLGRPAVSLSDDRRTAEVSLKVFDGNSGKSLAGQPVRLTVIEGRLASEHTARIPQ